MFSCDLRGKNALVTGASSGIGAHLALTLASAGAHVAACARRADRLAATVDEIRSKGGTAEAISLDVRHPISIEAAFIRAEERFGPIDVLINNAGTTFAKPALDIEPHEWDAVLDVNLRGAFLTAQACARHLVARDLPGSIVNVTSILAEGTAPNLAAYAASKAGLAHLTRVLALEFARHRIRVNAIAPGYVVTEMNRAFFSTPAGEAMVKRIPQRRLGKFEDLDGPVLLLASDASSYVTGAFLAIDGGHLVRSL